MKDLITKLVKTGIACVVVGGSLSIGMNTANSLCKKIITKRNEKKSRNN